MPSLRAVPIFNSNRWLQNELGLQNHRGEVFHIFEKFRRIYSVICSWVKMLLCPTFF